MPSGIARKLAHALKDAIRRGKFLVDALLVGFPAPDLASEAATVGVNCRRDAEVSDQGHKEVDFIFDSNSMAKLVLRAFAKVPNQRVDGARIIEGQKPVAANPGLSPAIHGPMGIVGEQVEFALIGLHTFERGQVAI